MKKNPAAPPPPPSYTHKHAQKRVRNKESILNRTKSSNKEIIDLQVNKNIKYAIETIAR